MRHQRAGAGPLRPQFAELTAADLPESLQ